MSFHLKKQNVLWWMIWKLLVLVCNMFKAISFQSNKKYWLQSAAFLGDRQSKKIVKYTCSDKLLVSLQFSPKGLCKLAVVSMALFWLNLELSSKLASSLDILERFNCSPKYNRPLSITDSFASPTSEDDLCWKEDLCSGGETEMLMFPGPLNCSM